MPEEALTNDFEALLAELAPLHKAMTTDGDAKIEAAAKEAGADTTAAEVVPPADTTDEGEGEGLGKSFAVTLEDGTVQDAFDATDLVKSLNTRLDAAETAAEQHGTDLTTAREDLAKSLTISRTLFEMVKSQDTLIKSLQTDMARIGGQGKGRVAAVTIAERNPAPAVVQKPNGEQLMAKAMTLVGAGGLSSSDIATVEMSLQRGMPLPAHIAAALETAA